MPTRLSHAPSRTATTRLQHAARPGWPALGVASLYVFAASVRLSTTLSILALSVMLFAFIADAIVERRTPGRDALVWLSAAALTYLGVRALWAAAAQPDAAWAHLNDALALAQLWLFAIAAWWIRGEPRRAAAVLALALTSLAIGSVARMGTDDLLMLLTVQRLRELLGLPTNAYALYAATALLGLMLLARRLWGAPGAGLRGLRIVLWLLALGFFAQAVIAAQSRATWIACLLLFPPLLWQGARAWWQAPRPFPRGEPAALAAGAAVLAALIALNAGTIVQRLGTETRTLAEIARGDTAEIPAERHSSYGLRFHLQRAGVEYWRERPWLGWGPGATPMLIDRLPQDALHGYSHVHNSYLELLLRLGIAGLALYVLAPALVAVRLRQARRRGTVPRDLALFLYGALGLLAAWSLFDFRMINTDWRFCWIVVVGLAAGMSERQVRGPGSETGHPVNASRPAAMNPSL